MAEDETRDAPERTGRLSRRTALTAMGGAVPRRDRGGGPAPVPG
jgi:hypothetical protein